jgi:predicted RNA-binding protein
VDEVMKLVAERAKYEKFLVELDKDGASKPANVVARVRADYTTKLEAVGEKLKASHDVLTEHSATLTTQLQKLQDAAKRFEDEAAELDLRKQVGEIEQEEWQTASDRVNADASKIKKQQEVTAADIKRIRDVLGSSGCRKPLSSRIPQVRKMKLESVKPAP